MPPRAAVGALRGTVIGPPRGTQLTIQRRVGDGWRDVGRVPTRADGAYRWVAHERGTYRVVADGAAGPRSASAEPRSAAARMPPRSATALTPSS